MERAVASILGGAIGDALGVAYEIFPKSNSLDKIHAQVLSQRKNIAKKAPTTYQDGGPWVDKGLVMKAGEWTDDTAMMLCLSDSLLFNRSLKVEDLMVRFIRWWTDGYNSSSGRAVGLGGNIKKAIYSFNPEDPNRLLGGTNPATDAGNGSLMRLAPVPVYYHDSLAQTIQIAKLQTATTHFVQETLEGSVLMAVIIWHGINGFSKNEVIDDVICGLDFEHPEIAELGSKNAGWRTKKPDQIRTLPGRCLWTLEAAMWCVYHTASFKEALLQAVSLGGDCDTVASITGQIAGAFYGRSAIPKEWLDGLRHREKIENKVVALYNHEPYKPKTMDL